jgi:proline dehydrogenase
MLRSLLIYLSKANWARNLVTRSRLARRTALRFVAGERPEDAIRAIRELNGKGILATLDHLGEHTNDQTQAVQATDDIIHILEQIDQGGVRSNVSIKLSQIGLILDEGMCRDNLIRILTRARELDNFVRIDMEDSSILEQTLRLYRDMRQLGFENVGVVIQSYLRRSEQDVIELMAEKARVRLVKGAYLEPPDIAFPDKSEVDRNFDRLTDLLIDGALAAGAPRLSQNGRFPPIPAIASHDVSRLDYAQKTAQERGLPQDAIEYQMLFGIRRDLQGKLVAEGNAVRVYVPYGREWYPYFMRRLAERPANLWFFLSNLFR